MTNEVISVEKARIPCDDFWVKARDVNNYDVLGDKPMEEEFLRITEIIDRDAVVFVTRAMKNQYAKHMERLSPQASTAIVYGETALMLGNTLLLLRPPVS